MPIELLTLRASRNRTLPQRHIAVLVQHFRKGRFAVLPTETGPMLACDALNEDAVKTLFRLKGRGVSNPIHVALPDLTLVDKYVFANASARRVMEALLPGPLTVICPKKDIISDLLTANTGNLGVRIPDCPATLLICAAAGVPLTATSLNVSGRPPRPSVEDTVAQLDWEGPNIVYNVADESQEYLSEPSTVVRITHELSAEILREGPIKEPSITQAMRQLSVDDMADWG